MAGVAVPRFETQLQRALLVVTLALSCLLGFATSYLLTILIIALFIHYLVQRRRFVVDLPARVFFFSFLALGVVFAIDARQPIELIYLVNFAAFLNYAVFSTGYARAAGPANTAAVADLALIGTAAGCAFALVDRLLLGHARAGSFITDPIRLADTALILGFLCLVGVLAHKDARRWLYLLGPVLALITIILTGSRGALMAFTPMVILAALLLARRRLLAIGLGAAFLLAFGLIVAFTDVLGARFEALTTIVTDLGRGSVIGDEGTRIRFELYKAAWAAFQQSPLTGHGWARMMSSIAPVPERGRQGPCRPAAPPQRSAELCRVRGHRRRARLSRAARAADRRVPQDPARQPVPRPALRLCPADAELFPARPARYHAQLRAPRRALCRPLRGPARLLPRSGATTSSFDSSG